MVCYINSSAEVKAASDVCVTSGNVYSIIERLPQREILFVPDRLMAANISREMKARGSDKVIHSSDGTCLVHDQFTVEAIAQARVRYPGGQGGEPPRVPHRRDRRQRLRGQHRQDDGVRARHRRHLLHAAHRVRAGEPRRGGRIPASSSSAPAACAPT